VPSLIQGVLNGLSATFLGVLQNFQAGDVGVCVIDPVVAATLPVPMWAEYGWLFQGLTAEVAIAFTGTQVVYTLPLDERALLSSIFFENSTGDGLGDNTVDEIYMLAPAGYGEGTRQIKLIVFSAGRGTGSWPLPIDSQSRTNPPPIWMEPGTQIIFNIIGAGSVATQFYLNLVMRKTKLVRALAP